MNTPWRYILIGTVLLACLLSACAPPKPSTEVPITTASEDARKLFLEGREKFENLELEKAAALFDQAIQKDSKFALAYMLRSQSGGGYTVALENRNKAIDLAGSVSPGERMMIKYDEAQAAGQTAKQKVYLDSLLEAFPMDKRVQFGAGLYYRALGDLKTAIAYYEKAIALDSSYALPYNLLGYENMSLGRPEAAEKAFKKYIQLLPNVPNPIDSYAEFLRMSGRYDESIAQYQKVLDLDPTFVSSISGIGDCYLRKGDAAKAREYYHNFIDKAAQVNTKVGGYYSLAASYVQEGDIAGAVKVLEDLHTFALAQNQNPTAVWALANQGFVLCSIGEPKRGLKKFQEGIDLTNNAFMSDATRGYLLFNADNWLRYASVQVRDMVKAKEYLAALTKNVERRGNPGEADLVKGAKGHIAFKEGRYDEAIQELSSLPDDPFTLYLLAFAHMKKGEKDAAGQAMTKLKRWGPVTLDYAVAMRLAAAMPTK
jgi:tetratricopeptide (TPR) repeat protein